MKQKSNLLSNGRSGSKATPEESPILSRFLNSAPIESRQAGLSRKSLPKQSKGLQTLCSKQKRQNTSADKGSEATLRARPNRSDSRSESNLIRDTRFERRLGRSQKIFIGSPVKIAGDRGNSPKSQHKGHPKVTLALSHHDLLLDRIRTGTNCERLGRIDFPSALIAKPHTSKHSHSKAFLNSHSRLNLRRLIGRSPECDKTSNSSCYREGSPASATRTRNKKKQHAELPTNTHLRSNRPSSPRPGKI